MKLDCLYPRNPMHARRFPQLAFPVIITGVTACDNVALDGIQVEPRPPEETQGDPTLDTAAQEQLRVLEPLLPVEPDPLLYAVERTHGSPTTILPFPHLSEDGYRPRLGTLDAALKVCGETIRSLTMLRPLDEDWSILHLDACGKPAYQGAIRLYL